MAISKRKPGALGPHVEGFQSYLLGRGYTPGTVRGQMKLLGHLGRWMEARGLSPEDLTAAVIDAFLAEVRQERRFHRADRRTAFQVLEHLVEQGVVVRPRLPSRSLSWSCSSTTTGTGCCASVAWPRRRCGATRTPHDASSPSGPSATADPAAGVTSVEVNSFLLAESARCSVGAAKGRVAELRSLLRYLFVRGVDGHPVGGGGPAGGGLAQHRHPADRLTRGRPGNAGQL